MNKTNPAPLEIKFAKIKAVAFVLHPAPQQESLDALKKRLWPSPSVYWAEPAVLDFSSWSVADHAEYNIDLAAYVNLLKSAGVHIVEVCGLNQSLEVQAEQLGLRHGLSSSSNIANEQPPESVVESGPAVSESLFNRRTMLIEQSVRSGQKIYAQGADLVVMGQVSAGAEVIADGNVHVYGVLRGRALAGAAGDLQAKIISTCFEAELVAVAGYYLTFEGGFPEENRSKPTFIHLDHGNEPAVLRLKAINIR